MSCLPVSAANSKKTEQQSIILFLKKYNVDQHYHDGDRCGGGSRSWLVFFLPSPGKWEEKGENETFFC